MKLCPMIVLLKTFQNTKKKFQKSYLWRQNDVITKQWENSDLRETG